MASDSRVQISNPKDVAPPKPTYSHVGTYSTTKPCRIVSVAGQGPVDINYELASPDMDGQVKAAIDNLGKCLRSVGAEPKDVIKVTHYIVDYDHTKREWTRHFVEFFGGVPPPTTLIPVTALAWPGWLYEIEALAVVPEA